MFKPIYPLWQAVALMMLAIGAYASQDLLIKLISPEVGFGQIILMRSSISFLPVILLAFWMRAPLSFKTQHLGKHLLRASLAFAALLCFIYAFTQMPLSQAYTLTFTAPLFLTLLSRVWLKESMNAYHWGCVVLGFVGVCLTMRPDFQTLQGGASIALLGGLVYASSLLLIRDLNRSDGPITILLFFTLLSTCFGACLAVSNWQPLALEQLIILIGIGMLGGIAQCLMTLAFCKAPASFLAPFDYIALLWGLALDCCLFSYVPTFSAVAGALLIIAAGLLMFIHEGRKAV